MPPADFGYLETGIANEAPPDILAAVSGRFPVVVDSGFRRGTHVVKAVALRASGTATGRPYLWTPGAFGEAGVTRVLEVRRRELATAMQQVGAPDSRALVPQIVRHA